MGDLVNFLFYLFFSMDSLPEENSIDPSMLQKVAKEMLVSNSISSSKFHQCFLNNKVGDQSQVHKVRHLNNKDPINNYALISITFLGPYTQGSHKKNRQHHLLSYLAYLIQNQQSLYVHQNQSKCFQVWYLDKQCNYYANASFLNKSQQNKKMLIPLSFF